MWTQLRARIAPDVSRISVAVLEVECWKDIFAYFVKMSSEIDCDRDLSLLFCWKHDVDAR